MDVLVSYLFYAVVLTAGLIVLGVIKKSEKMPATSDLYQRGLQKAGDLREFKKKIPQTSLIVAQGQLFNLEYNLSEFSVLLTRAAAELSEPIFESAASGYMSAKNKLEEAGVAPSKESLAQCVEEAQTLVEQANLVLDGLAKRDGKLKK